MKTSLSRRTMRLLAIGALALMSVRSDIGAGQTTPPPAALFVAIDANRDGTVNRAEMRAAFSGWFTAWDGRKTGSLTQAQIAAGLSDGLGVPAPAIGGRVASETDVQEMLKALPSAAPARPVRPRQVLVLADSPGFTHSSIPLAARTIEELGRKTGAWSTTVTYDPAVITVENLGQFDAILLDSTVGAFLDEAGDQAVTESRRAAFLAFVRGGKGLVGFHAASDAYHAGQANTPFTRTAPMPAQLAAVMVAQGDKDADQKLTLVELTALIDAWSETLDSAKTNRISQAEFVERFAAIVPAGAGREGRGGRAGGRGGAVGAGRGTAPSGATWPEFNRMIGGIFKSHPWQRAPVRIEDAGSPLTAMFRSPSFEFQDEIYSFFQDSWSRTNLRVLMSIDYARMSDADKAREPNASARTDGDYGLSWIRREGLGRVFYFALGHREDGIYRSSEMLQHLLAGIQYAIGDLKADDTPSARLSAEKPSARTP
jgi:type 1 glutamine amidotransferase